MQILVQKDGKIVLEGTANRVGPSGTANEVDLVRFDPSGKIDRSFSIDGVAEINDPALTSALGIAADHAGRLIVAVLVAGVLMLESFRRDGRTDGTYGSIARCFRTVF